MSPKELLYTEDALGHCQQIKACCQESSSRISDTELKNFITSIAQKQAQCFERFYGLLK